MNLYCLPSFNEPKRCPYLPQKKMRLQYFLADSVTAVELDTLFEQGWRKFGGYFFRPACIDCQSCIPIRIPVKNFALSKSQRRILRKGKCITMEIKTLAFKKEIYLLYLDHSMNRFHKSESLKDFMNSFYQQSCPAFQSEYYHNNELIAVGFIDQSIQALSSVYFVYKTAFSRYSLGTYSIIRETNHTAEVGKKYYYLGYYIADNPAMSYKNKFKSNQKFDWTSGIWKDSNVQD